MSKVFRESLRTALSRAEAAKAENTRLLSEGVEVVHDLRAKLDVAEAEVERLRIDLSKPPQEREYCAGCSLPAEAKRLREAVEWAGDHAVTFQRATQYGTAFLTEDFKAELCRRAALKGEEEGKG